MTGSWILAFREGKSVAAFPLVCLLAQSKNRVKSVKHRQRRPALDAVFVLCNPSPRRWKSVPPERAASSKMELFKGAWGLRPQQATWDIRASENARFGLGGSHEALLAGFSYPVFMPFRAVFLQMRKEDAYTSSFSSSASFNLMAPSMTPSTMGRYFSGQSCNLWLVRWRCSLSSRSSSGLK